MTVKKKAGFPFLASRILKHTIPAQDFIYLNGNFEDLYENYIQNKGKLYARIWLWGEILKSFPGFIWAVLYWRVSMFKNYFTIALRNIRKHKVYSFINILGLSLGMAVCMLIFLWVNGELGYDRFHAHKNEVAQVYSELHFSNNQTQVFMGSYYPLARIIKEECPDIREATRYQTASGVLIKYGEKQFLNDVVGLVDASFFDIFSFPFIQGSPESALSDNLSTVITEKMARKYFGDEDPMGKPLNINGALDLKVNGVISDIPARSSLNFDCLAPFALIYNFTEPTHWGGNPFSTYVRLPKNPDFVGTSEKITAIVKKHNPRETSEELFLLHPLSKKHLISPQGGSLLGSLKIFSLIAFFVLIIACINFMNLSTAQAARRAKEIGLRKVVGARKSDLIKQFIGESFAFTLITLVFALIFLRLFLPTFNQLLGKQLSLDLLFKPTVILGFLAITLFTGFFAGSYPSFFLSAFQPVNILRGMSQSRFKNLTFRKILVVVQFSLSIFMIISMTTTYKQLRYLQNKDLGFDRDNLVFFPATQNLQEHFESFKGTLINNPQIISVSRSLQGPWNINSTVSAVEWDGRNPEERINMHWDYVDYDYFQTLGLDVFQGRPFSKEYSTDSTQAYLVNEEAVKLMGMDSPVGQRLSVFRNEGTIIGVVKNFHFQPMYHEIKPFIFMLRPESSSNIFVKLKPDHTPMTLESMKKSFLDFEKDRPFNPLFFNDILRNQIYSSEIQTSKISSYFTLLAIVISGLGLFGLAAFMAEQRTKEIGVRKVLGASVSSVVVMLSKDFTKWVVLANIFAWPAAYFILRRLLVKYAYHVNLGLDIFIFSALAALFIAIVAVSYQAIKAALANPVKSLRYE